MDSHSKETLSRVEQNDSRLTCLILDTPWETDPRWGYYLGCFNSNLEDDYLVLGKHIENNTHITELRINLRIMREQNFLENLVRNSSINNVMLVDSIDNGLWRSILGVYQHNNNLTCLDLVNISCHDNAIADTIKCCTKLRKFTMRGCNITGEQLVQLVENIKGHSLEILYFYNNNIGNVGCDTFATLLKDPKCNLHTLDLKNNRISNEGVIALVDSLVKNTKLKKLDLCGNPINNSVVEDSISRLLCNTSSINSIYASNHTLEKILLSDWNPEEQLSSLLCLNGDKFVASKMQVAIKKILIYHPNIDMEPLYDWDSEGEWTLKALPYVIDWFERAKEVVDSTATTRVESRPDSDEKTVDSDEENTWSTQEYRPDSGEENVESVEEDAGKRYIFTNLPTITQKERVEAKKLSSIYQFARSMPLIFVAHLSHVKVAKKKRKRKHRRCNYSYSL